MSKHGGYEDQPFLAELYDYHPLYTGRADVDVYVSYSKSVEGKSEMPNVMLKQVVAAAEPTAFLDAVGPSS